jgi:hypothetical protein
MTLHTCTAKKKKPPLTEENDPVNKKSSSRLFSRHDNGSGEPMMAHHPCIFTHCQCPTNFRKLSREISLSALCFFSQFTTQLSLLPSLSLFGSIKSLKRMSGLTMGGVLGTPALLLEAVVFRSAVVLEEKEAESSPPIFSWTEDALLSDIFYELSREKLIFMISAQSLPPRDR